MDSMTVEEKYERLEHMLQYAASKADSLKGLLSKYCDENGNMISVDSARFRREKRNKYASRLKQLEQEVLEMEGTVESVERERDEANAERDGLLDDLRSREARIEDQPADLETRNFESVDTDRRLEQLQTEMDAVGLARDDAESDRENLAERIVRLEEELNVARASSREMSEEIEVLQRTTDAATNERDEIEVLQHTIESLTENDTTLRREGEQFARELAEVREEANRLRDELAAAEKSVRNGNSNDSADVAPVAKQSAPLSVEGELVGQLGDPLMDSYLRFLHTKPAKDGKSFDE